MVRKTKRIAGRQKRQYHLGVFPDHLSLKLCSPEQQGNFEIDNTRVPKFSEPREVRIYLTNFPHPRLWVACVDHDMSTPELVEKVGVDKMANLEDQR